MHVLSRLGLLLALLAVASVVPPAAQAQGGAPEAEAGPGLRFNGLGRSYIQQSDLGGAVAETDTSTAENLSDGNFVLDLAVNAQPNRVTEVQGTIRLRNEFGGFFGAGATVEIRELWARGVIANRVRYRLGDMNLALTPYTLYLPEEDGLVNEPELFVPQREVIEYEEFYTGLNERRLQGATADFALAFTQAVEEVDTRVFVARLRATDFVAQPTRLISGGRLGATSATIGPFDSRVNVGGNLSYVWDDLESGDANTGIRNLVYSFDTDVTLLDRTAYTLSLVGEAGRSSVDRRTLFEEVAEGRDSTATSVDESDTFVEVGLAADLGPRGVGVSATFVNVGPDFYSAAAQSKRVDYNRALESYNRIGNDQARRAVSLFDLTRDQGLYTFRVADALMAYDPRYGNVLPYGRATPNRRGLRLAASYEIENRVEAILDVALLSEIRGQGTTELKDFVRVQAGADVPIGALTGLDRLIEATLGVQFESTQRGGGEFEEVDLTSTLVEAGLSVEVYDRLDVLLGGKYRTSSGSDYLAVIENFNDVRDFPGRFVTDDSEALYGAGLRYRFRDDVYLTLQAQRFSYSDDGAREGQEPGADYQIGQVFALYSMTF